MERRRQTTARSPAQGSPLKLAKAAFGDSDAPISLDQLQREAYAPAALEQWSATQAYLMSCTRRYVRQPLRLVPAPVADQVNRAPAPATRVPSSSADALERAADILMRGSPWFGLSAPASDGTKSAGRDASPPLVVEDVGGGLVLPMVFRWSRVGAVLGGIASSAAVLVGLWLSTSGSLAWLPALPPPGGGPVLQRASLGVAPHLTARKERETPVVAPRTSQMLGEAAVDGMLVRASKTCASRGVAPAKFHVHAVFSTTGQVQNATVAGLGGATAGAARCVRAMVRSSRIAPFSGDTVSVARIARVE